MFLTSHQKTSSNYLCKKNRIPLHLQFRVCPYHTWTNAHIPKQWVGVWLRYRLPNFSGLTGHQNIPPPPFHPFRAYRWRLCLFVFLNCRSSFDFTKRVLGDTSWLRRSHMRQPLHAKSGIIEEIFNTSWTLYACFRDIGRSSNAETKLQSVWSCRQPTLWSEWQHLDRLSHTN